MVHPTNCMHYHKVTKQISCCFLFLILVFLLAKLQSTSMIGLVEGGVRDLPKPCPPKSKGPGGGLGIGEGSTLWLWWEAGHSEADPSTHPIIQSRMKASYVQVISPGEPKVKWIAFTFATINMWFEKLFDCKCKFLFLDLVVDNCAQQVVVLHHGTLKFD